MAEVGIASGRSFGWFRAYVEHRYAILFYSLLFTLAAGPVSAALGFGGGPIELFLAANLLMSVMPVAKRRNRRVLIACLIILLTARLATVRLDHPVPRNPRPLGRMVGSAKLRATGGVLE